MKKLKLFQRFLITLLVVNSLFFSAQIYNFTVFEGEFHFSDFAIEQFVILMSIIGLFFLQSAIYSIIKNGFFNQVAHTKFSISGLFFIISGFGSILLSCLVIVKNSYDVLELLNSNLVQNLLLIVVGFSLFIIADIVKNGNILKTENDLTI